MSAQPVDIQILGKSLRINCPQEQREALSRAAADLNQRLLDLKERTRVTNSEQLILTAALNISYELTQEKDKTDEYAKSMEMRIRMLQDTIEQALVEQSQISQRRSANFE
ncbi:cell division protein ZapA [Leminorella grimontii]|uniref:Cell division protein ZapA n=1 Tax=Leminorella grimontii TaxID=82981 RepID=A0AAV5NA83_9GAMM|nr:cell division protein ZapA [Leminorella grimontii]KFC98221.1 ZapA family Z-ring-associated protein [Leminorella grimontii ATCC 33999 = DSM 5078]GKX57512.1 cell division protein ZapA [Leminorella grimontii]GKX60992.1 cell division protein ZapA [Leminorella grimontii]VFS56147.1 Z ring-associated protein ZapA [Leminorella grimontii]